MFEKRLDLPTAAIYGDDSLQWHVKIVGKQRDKFRMLAFLDIEVCDYTGDMIDAILAERHNLLPIFHNSLRILMHTVHKHLIIEVFLHPGDINYSAVSHLLELGIVDVGAVHRRYIMSLIMAWSEHERVVSSRRCELYVARHRVDALMMQSTDFRRHGSLYLSQRIATLYHGIKHCHQMCIAVKALDLLLSAVLTADFNCFSTVE